MRIVLSLAAAMAACVAGAASAASAPAPKVVAVSAERLLDVATEALDRAQDVGQATPGHYGDLVGVNGDALSDVTVLEHPAFVMKGGEVVKRVP